MKGPPGRPLIVGLNEQATLDETSVEPQGRSSSSSFRHPADHPGATRYDLRFAFLLRDIDSALQRPIARSDQLLPCEIR